MSKLHRSQIGGAVFLIGLGIIALLNFWWPGIMFVVAASVLATVYAETNTLSLRSWRVIGAAITVLVGLIGLVPNFNFNWGGLWPILLIFIGVVLLFGWNLSDRDKRKNE